jgi:hypothetical protein
MIDKIVDLIFHVDMVFIFLLSIFGIEPSFFIKVFGYLNTQLVTLWQRIMVWTRS